MFTNIMAMVKGLEMVVSNVKWTHECTNIDMASYNSG